MPATTTVVTSAQIKLFRNSYYNCRALRDIIAYVDGTAPELKWDNNPKVSRELFNAIILEEFRENVGAWRVIFSREWQQLEADNLVIVDLQEHNDRSIDQLSRVYNTTSLMLRTLEMRLFGILLRRHLRPSAR